MTYGQPTEIPLYHGVAPGSEDWNWSEGKNNKNSVGVMTVYNVSRPTLTVYLPDRSTANGAAVIICPGGGFHFLAIDHEGTTIAKALVSQGFTVFILKYRLCHIKSDNPFDDMINAKDPKAWDDEALPIILLAIEDGRNAIAWVRTHASDYKLNSNKVGIMGFSAGGMVSASSAFGYNTVNRPDFVVVVYGDIPESRQRPLMEDAPPLYLLCTQDDEFGFATHAISMYNKWYNAKRPVEMKLFAKGGHGFGIGSSENTTFNWLDGVVAWLKVMEIIK
jgi:acetyl esterase/lipase